MRKAPESQYASSLVAYVDILGFKDRVEGHRGQLEVERIRNDLEYARRLGTNWTSAEAANFRCKCFSDSMAMSVPFGHGTLSRFLMHILQLQAQLARREVFIRGAIVAGKHFEDKNIVFGPALIRAVELEKTVAQWPRVVVHPDVTFLVKKLGLWLDQEKKDTECEFIEGRKGLLRCDHDGISCIDYLRHFPSKQWVVSGSPIMPQPEGDEYVAIHRSNIVKKAKENRSNLRVFTKYYWAASYHNNTVEKDTLKIQLSELLSGI
jgi:hypothetical protein